MQDNKYNTLLSIFEVEDIPLKLENKYSYLQILSFMSKEKYSIGEELGISDFKARELVKLLWPDKPSTNMKVCTWLLHKYGMKYCASCKLVKEVELFSSNKAKATGLNTHCKSCYTENTREYQREYQKTRKAMKLSRVPSWANIEKIREIYSACPSGHHVDHIVPLQGKFVSGLHVETNLQYLPALENLRKHNKF
jgi:hypothetical protein